VNGFDSRAPCRRRYRQEYRDISAHCDSVITGAWDERERVGLNLLRSRIKAFPRALV